MSRVRVLEEEQHGEDFIAQVGVQFAQGTLALQVEGHLQNGFDLFLAEVQVADQVAVT
jgi:hypothetical protein